MFIIPEKKGRIITSSLGVVLNELFENASDAYVAANVEGAIYLRIVRVADRVVIDRQHSTGG